MSERRKRLHEILLALIKKEADFQLIEDDSNDFANSFSDNDSCDFSQVIKRNRKILRKYQSLIRTAVALDALMDSENEQNFKIN